VISPTGKKVRGHDHHGSGAYGALRGDRKHTGSDYVGVPGQSVVSPINGKIIRESRPYADGPWSGCVIEGKHMTIQMFYVKMNDGLIGKQVCQGEIIGRMQNIGQKYPGITPHVHLSIKSINPEIFTNYL